MENFVQIAILVPGALAIWLVSGKGPWMKWGFVLGLLSQPFWLITTWQHGQWGVFALACWYTVSWGRGIKNNWRGPISASVG